MSARGLSRAIREERYEDAWAITRADVSERMERMRERKQHAPRSRPKARNAKRMAREFARAYGSTERVAFVQTLPCIVCDYRPCEAAHVVGGGTNAPANLQVLCKDCNLRKGPTAYASRRGVA